MKVVLLVRSKSTYRSEPLCLVKHLIWPPFNQSGHKPHRVSCNPMPPNSIQTGLIERAKARLPQTETAVDCFKVPLTLGLKGEGFRCSSKRHLIPRSDRWVTCQCGWVRPERSGLRKLTAALLWPLIWKCCVKSSASSGILSYSHNSRRCGMPGSFFWILFAFYKRLFQRCHQVWVTTYQRRHKNMKNMSDVYDTICSWCIWWCLLSASVWLTSKEWVLLWFYDFGNAIKEPCSSSINKDSDYLLSLV